MAKKLSKNIQSLNKKKIAISILAILTAILSIELVLRLLSIGSSEKDNLITKSNNPVLSYELKKNYTREIKNSENVLIRYHSNSEGFRGEELAEYDSGSNLLCLGDSTTFGWGMQQENTFCSQLSTNLSTANSVISNPINLAVPGYNLEQVKEVYRVNSKKYFGNWVILGYLLNDVSPTADWEWDEAKNRISLKNEPKLQEGSYKGPFGGRFPWAKFLDTVRLYNLAIRPLLIPPKETIDLYHANNKSEFEIYQQVYFDPNFKNGWESKKQVLNELNIMTKANNQRLLVIVFPLAYQLINNTNTNPQDKITTYLEENGIEYIDLLPFFKETKLEAKKLFSDNAHPTVLGHKIIGDKISQIILGSI